MDKLTMAHEYAIALINSGCEMQFDKFIQLCWNYADTMQAEAEKKRNAVREMLNADNTFLEKEGQHFDDVCSDEIHAQRDAELYGCGFLKVTYNENGVKYERLNPMTVSLCAKNIGLDSDFLKEWQPDWSQAPEWAEWWAIDGFGDKKAHWYRDKPYLDDDSAIEDEWNADLDSQKESFVKAPSFNYQGNWQDSLRKRPSNI